MIDLAHPLALALALPWGLLAWWLARRQLRAWLWVATHTDPRFRPLLTVHSRRTLAAHLSLLAALGLALLLAAAGPSLTGRGEEESGTGRLVLVLDASASMRAEDVEGLAPSPEAPGEGTEGAPTDAVPEALRNRLEVSREVARRVVEALPGWQFALITFSGTATLSLPMTGDGALVLEALRAAETHSFYRYTGSSFAAALDAALHFADPREGGLQALLLSDGEQPFAAGFDEPLAALARQEVAVHTVAVGSREGESRLIFDFRDVAAGKPQEERRVLREFTTRRVDEHLQAVSRRTGGHFAVASPAVAEEMVAAIRRRQEEGHAVEDEAARRDLSALPLGLFLAGFLLHTLALGRQRPAAPPGFDLKRLGRGPQGPGAPPGSDLKRLSRGPQGPAAPPGSDLTRSGLGLQGRTAPPGSDPKRLGRGPQRRAGGATLSSTASLLALPALGALLSLAAVLLALTACRGDDPTRQAHRQNELGIARDLAAQHRAARRHYERSRAFGVRPEIPTYNLARSTALAGDHSEAHDLYQQALELAPDLAPAHYNDGVSLYRWGEAERDPQGCDLERTHELWQAAHKRFATALELAGEKEELGKRARENLAFLTTQLAEVKRLIQNPPPACQADAQGGGGGGGGTGGGGEGGGGARSEGEGEGQGGGGGGTDPNQGGGEGGGGQGQDPNQDPGGGGQGQGQGGSAGQGRGPGTGTGGGGLDAEGAGGTGGTTPLSPQELEQIRQALERMRQEALGEGKYYRRTGPEQFPRDVWENPDDEIWW